MKTHSRRSVLGVSCFLLIWVFSGCNISGHHNGGGNGDGSQVPGPEITTTSLPSPVLNAPFTATISATGTSPFSWSAVAASPLPSWLALSASTSSSVSLQGTPTTVGEFSFAVQVTDATGQSAEMGFSVAVNGPAVKVTTTSLAAGTLNEPYNAVLQGTGGASPLFWSLTLGYAPGGLEP